MKDLITIKPDGTAELNFHSGQLQAWDAEQRYVFILAGTQSGKTSFGPWWLYREIQAKGAGDYLAVTANYDLFKLKMLPEMRKVFEDLLGIGKYWKSNRVMELSNPETGVFEAQDADDKMWARIILRSATAGAKKGRAGARALESSTVKGVWIDECGLDEFGVEAWEAIKRRTAIHKARIFGTTSLYGPTWLKQRVYTPYQLGDKDFFVVQFDSTMNPLFPKEEFEDAKKTMQTWKFNMLYRGVFDKPAGMIYPDFNEDFMVIPTRDLPPEWPRYVGIDPGALNTATIWIAEDVQQKAFYVYRETLEGELTTKQHAQKALDFTTNERVVKWTGGAKSEKQFRIDWQDAGVPLEEPGVIEVEIGIDRITELIKEKRLFIFDTCKGLIDEFSAYSRKLDENGEPTPVILNKERYHRLDALRYDVIGIRSKKVVQVLIPRAS